MFNWTDYLNLAIELSEREEEGCKRTAVSRAYYSVYRNTRNYLEGKGLKLDSRENAHFAVWNAVAMIKEGNVNEISIIAERLMRKRKQVDYDNKVNQLDKLTSRAITEAKQIQSIIDKNTVH